MSTRDVPPEFKCSVHGMCLAEGYADKLKKLQRYRFKKTDAWKPDGAMRDFVRVNVGGDPMWADYVTGALYSTKDGSCFTGSGRIEL